MHNAALLNSQKEHMNADINKSLSIVALHYGLCCVTVAFRKKNTFLKRGRKDLIKTKQIRESTYSIIQFQNATLYKWTPKYLPKFRFRDSIGAVLMETLGVITQDSGWMLQCPSAMESRLLQSAEFLPLISVGEGLHPCLLTWHMAS